ncbi:PCI domain-containing protein [Favolaschia claudopus]|uniref:PCI domain-containing protein n=1 Tax=Favolaschia claudopus TaxID=2862362 RepID=A0AAW0A9Y0_9AGAR
MDLGSNFAAKLEPFLLMAKSIKGAAAAKLISDATSAPGVFVFSELLELPNVQELSKNETHAKSYALLELFAYRTYEDYMQNKDAYPPLNAAQTTKLKHLSIVSFASQRRILPYADLLRALDMPTVRELEDLIIDAIYLDVLRGRLDQKQAQLEVEYTMGRDLAPGAVDAVLAALQNWASTTASVLSTLDAKLAAVAARSAEHKDFMVTHDTALQTALAAAAKDKSSMRGTRGLGMGGMGYGGNVMHGGDPMDVDEPGGMERMSMMRGDQENIKGKGRKPAPDSGKPQRKRNRF